MAAQYVEIDRGEVEGWLDTIVEGGLAAVWSRAPRTEGVYRLHLSQAVCVTVATTVTRNGSVVGRGEAHTDIRLSSLIDGRTLNRKATGQSRFHRTAGWRQRWGAGVQRLVETYRGSREFYERIALTPSAPRSEATLPPGEAIKAIESIPGWQDVNFLVSLAGQARRGASLTERQTAVLRDIQAKRGGSR